MAQAVAAEREEFAGVGGQSEQQEGFFPPRPPTAPPLAAQDDSNFDCVGYFNPVAQADYERTVDAWADALLVVVNQSTLTMDEASRQ